MEVDQLPTKPINVLSLGAGVQSTTLALLGEKQMHGIPRFDFAVFADTGAEPQSVYDCLERIKHHVSYPVIITQHGDGLTESIMRATRDQHVRFASVPFFTLNDDGSVGMLRRQCTNEYKIQPVHKAIRERLEYKKGEKVKHVVNVWIGISRDEMTRMTTPRQKWMTHQYPLVDMEWRRSHCVDFLRKNWQWAVGKSSCTFCPYHDNKTWRDMKRNDPSSWTQAVNVDNAIRNGFKQTKEELYLHRSCQPLEEIDFDAILARNDDQRDFGFIEECEGMCGL